MSDVIINRLDDGIEAIKGDVKVTLEWIGEGFTGDYDESDPEDLRLMRFDVYKRDGNNPDEWIQVDDSSYCTLISLDTPDEIKEQAVRCLMDEFYDAVKSGYNVKKLGEGLSWIEPAWFDKSRRI